VDSSDDELVMQMRRIIDKFKVKYTNEPYTTIRNNRIEYNFNKYDYNLLKKTITKLNKYKVSEI
jgi:hypothetical protein